MKKDLTELVFVLDMSGSMSDLTDDTIGGFNSLIKDQKEGEGEALVSTVLFNTSTRVMHDRLPISEVEEMTHREYRAGGGTALLDALGGAIHHISNVHKYAREEDVPEKTLVVVTTDGMENSSRNYTYSKVKEMVERKQKEGWEFMFMGANIDAYESGERMGFRKERISNYIPDERGTRLVYESANSAIKHLRAFDKIEENWNVELDADFSFRK